MTEIPVPTGPTNRQIVDRAYQVEGLSDSMFGRTDDEYAAAMLPLASIARQWPFSTLGFLIDGNLPVVEEESGIGWEHLDGVAYALAERLAPTIGKTLSPEAKKVKADLYSRLCVATPPDVKYKPGTIRGAGGKLCGVFFPAPE